MDVAQTVRRQSASCQKIRCFGVYFDKPSDVPPEQCRASLGIMLLGDSEGRSEADLQELADALNEQPWATQKSLKAVVFPQSRFEFCVLPFYGMLSVVLGIWRAYSKLEVAAAMAGEGSDIKMYGSLEMYDDVEKKMYVGFPRNVRSVLLPFNVGT